MSGNSQLGTPAQRAERLRVIAAEILDGLGGRELIAEGFAIVACAMEPCTDCGNCQGQDADQESLDVLHPDDNPQTGV